MVTNGEGKGKILKKRSKQTLAVLAICLMLLFMLTYAVTLPTANAAKTIRVGQTSGVSYDYSTIQEAINSANSGDIINVDAGTYYENILVDKQLTLIGINQASVIIDGASTATTVTVTGDGVSISGFTIINGGGATFVGESGKTVGAGDGLYLQGSNTVLSGNFITGNQYDGVEVIGTNNVISGNRITANPEYGISIKSSNNAANGNEVTGCGTGITINGDNNQASGNTIKNGDTGITSSGASNTFYNNFITGFVYALSMDGDNNQLLGNIINANSYGVSLYSVTNSLISDNTVAHCSSMPNSFGLSIFHSDGNTIVNNHVFGNQFDITMEESNGNTLSHNQILDSQWDGLSLLHSANNQILYNTVDNNGLAGTPYVADIHFDGIRLDDSGYNTITGNTITRSYYGGIVLKSTDGLSGHDSSSYNEISSNCILNNKVGVEVSWYSHDNTIYSNTITYNNGGIGSFGVYLCEGVSKNDISANYISHNYYGVYLYDNAFLNYIHDNSICDNVNTGVVLSSLQSSHISPNYQCSNNQIYGNNIAGNKGSGISISGWGQKDTSDNSMDDGNEIHDNNVVNNVMYGITIYKSSLNHIYHNNIINNGAGDKALNAYSQNSVNNWDNGYPLGGNYWGDWKDYTGSGDVKSGVNQDVDCPDGDGIVDHYYSLQPADETHDKDRYPLTNPTQSITTTGSSTVPVTGGQINANYQIGGTGVDVNVYSNGGSVSGPADVTVIKYGSTQPPGTGNVNTGGSYFDVKVSSSSGSDLGSDVWVCITITDDSITSTTVMSYWDDKVGSWVPAQNQIYTPQHTLSGEIPASALTGTILEINDPAATTLSVGCNPQVVNKVTHEMATTIAGVLSLSSSGSGIEAQMVSLYYSTDGSTWTYIGKSSPTASDGSYSYTWNVPYSIANGEYQIKAEFGGDSNYVKSTATTNPGGNLFVVPEYALGALAALIACFAAFLVSQKKSTLSLKPRKL